jgi:hypothetical protein
MRASLQVGHLSDRVHLWRFMGVGGDRRRWEEEMAVTWSGAG